MKPSARNFNEAALVGHTNPELDAAEAAQKERQAGGVAHPAPLRDTVLQHALDLITSISAFYEGKPPDTVKPPQQ